MYSVLIVSFYVPTLNFQLDRTIFANDTEKDFSLSPLIYHISRIRFSDPSATNFAPSKKVYRSEVSFFITVHLNV